MDNLRFYNQMRECPKEALKAITDGKLKGKSDINPMWRIKVLTETFGPVGFGWYIEPVERWIETFDKQATAWVAINLFVRDPESGEWSKPIYGLGGSMQNGSGVGEGRINDEAFKMAETDAISVACKKLGIAADVYWNSDNTKYTKATTSGAGKKAEKKETEDKEAAPEMPPVTKAIEDANAAKDKATLTKVWNYYKGAYGDTPEFRKLVAQKNKAFKAAEEAA